MDSPIFRLKRRTNRYKSYGSARKLASISSATIYASLLLCTWIWFTLLTEGQLTVGGVPAHIIISFLQDEAARNAYFDGDQQKLHDRLQEMGVEDKIKAYYRTKIQDEVELDQHIHQIMYNRTGYVGKAYRVNSEGVLVLKFKTRNSVVLEGGR